MTAIAGPALAAAAAAATVVGVRSALGAGVRLPGVGIKQVETVCPIWVLGDSPNRLTVLLDQALAL
jgi:hypothetical protein